MCPAQRCGATGLRPTFGRVSRQGAMALSWTMDKVGPLCRQVEDTALVLDANQRVLWVQQGQGLATTCLAKLAANKRAAGPEVIHEIAPILILPKARAPGRLVLETILAEAQGNGEELEGNGGRR